MRKLLRLAGLSLLLICSIYLASARAQYVVNEILYIPWGEEANQLEIREPYLEYHDGPHIDTLGHLVAAGGPDRCFVDREENVYFISGDILYFKGFDPNGVVIVNYSRGKTEFKREFFRGRFSLFYVDSLGRIYCNGNEMTGAYVAVADRNNNLLDKLNPLGLESHIPVSIVYWGSDDVLIFHSWEYGYSTYMNGQFYPGGAHSWRASNGSYYSVKRMDPSTITFIRFENPDTTSRPAFADTSYVSYPQGGLALADLLGVDDNLRLYVKFWDASDSAKTVAVYDINYNLLEEFSLLPRQQNQYMWYIDRIFVRHDGNVYEFHCRDDGMHVFRWSKQ